MNRVDRFALVKPLDGDGGVRLQWVDALRVNMREEARDDDEAFALALLETVSLLDDGEEITLCVLEKGTER